MIYASYYDYANEYFGGTIHDESEFQRFSARASMYIDYITQGRARKTCHLEAVKMACCALAEQYKTIEAARLLAVKSLTNNDGLQELQSERVANWTKSYRSGGDSAQAAAQAAKAAEDDLYKIAQQYLANTGMLYRGGGCRHEHVPAYGDALSCVVGDGP